MKLYTALLAIVFTTSSCVHVYYAPNAANAPLLSEKGETRINGLYSTGGISEFSGGELQFAHAVSKNFGVMVNGMAAGRTDTWTDYTLSSNSYRNENGKGSCIEIAGGCFKTLDANKRVIGEIYSGFGGGSVKNDYDDGDNSQVNNFKFFIQPAIGYKSKFFEVALIPKLSFINWKVKEANVSTTNINSYVKHDLNYIASKKNFTAFEPAIIFRAGGENFKLQTELSFSNFSATSGFYSEDLIETLNASIGISINLKPIKK